MTNSHGFTVTFAAATAVLIASKPGLPVSTTHASVGGVLGVGLARGLEAVNFSTIFDNHDILGADRPRCCRNEYNIISGI